MKILDGNFWIVFGLLIALSGVALWRGGTPFLGDALGGGMKLFLRFGLVLFVSFLVAGLADTSDGDLRCCRYFYAETSVRRRPRVHADATDARVPPSFLGEGPRFFATAR